MGLLNMFSQNKFKATEKSKYIELDERNYQWRIVDKKDKNLIFPYESLKGYELDVQTNNPSTNGVSFGRAIVGNVLAGGVGAMLGGLTGKKQKNLRIMDIYIVLNINGYKKVITVIENANMKPQSASANGFNKLAGKSIILLEKINDANIRQSF